MIGILVPTGLSMDLSKLPKLSQTPQQTDAPAPDPGLAEAATDFCRQCGVPLRPGARFCDGCGATTAVRTPASASMAEAWISGIIGVIFMLLGKTFAAYVFSLITRQPFHTGINWASGEQAGTEVTYPQLQGLVIWTDSAMFIFGLALVMEALAIALSRSGLRVASLLTPLALLVAVLATLYNLVVVIMLFSQGILPILSLLAVAFGGYLVMSQWTVFRASRSPA